MASQRPSVARIVHYKSYGTPGGEYEPACRAAIVTAVDPLEGAPGHPSENVALCVLNPTGLFFREGVQHDEESKAGGTWHWPERVDG